MEMRSFRLNSIPRGIKARRGSALNHSGALDRNANTVASALTEGVLTEEGNEVAKARLLA
jgi:hypothetical protein